MGDAKKYFDDFQEPLHLERWPENERKVIEQLRAVYQALDPECIAEHKSLALRVSQGCLDDELHFGTPAFYSLLAYGRPGLDALYDLCLSNSSLAASDAGRALVIAALQRADNARPNVLLIHRYLERPAYERLQDRVVATCQDPKLANHARMLFFKMLRYFLTDPNERGRLGLILTGLEIVGGEDAVDLAWEGIASATLHISDELCNEAQQLIEKDLQETEYQRFLEAHPALLDPLAAEVVPRRALADLWKTDFVIKRFDNQYVFVELEKPRDRLFTQYPQPSKELAHSLGQVLSWFAWVEDNVTYARTHGFPEIHTPRAVIVLGRDSCLSPDQRRMLRTLNDIVDHRILIWTYDDMVQNARNTVANLVALKT